jgi:hypothetical protein
MPIDLRSRLNHPLAAAIGLCFVTAVGSAQAHDFCVANAVDLQMALTKSSDGGVNNGEDNTIMIVQNTPDTAYKTGTATGGGPFHYINSAATGVINVFGGYNSDCSVRTLKAALTILDGDHTTAVLTLTSQSADINVTGLTIQNGESTLAGAGLAVNPDDAQTSQVLVEENIIKNNHSTGVGGGVALYSGGSDVVLYFEKNLIVGNSSDNDDGGGFAVSNAGDLRILNNTIVENTTRVAATTTGGFQGISGANAQVWNNILLNNTNKSLTVSATTLSTRYNDYDVWSGPTLEADDGNVSVDPKFVDAADGDFHLRGNSPLLDVTPFTTVSPDVEGNPTPLGGKMDVGAFEETIFADDFEE